jgi:two-component sensor histidine kinase
MSPVLAERAWSVVVPHHARGARIARHRLGTELAGSINPDMLADVIAVVAELVGNAIRHAEPLPGDVVRVSWRLRTTSRGQEVRIRVTDGGSGKAPRVRQASLEAVDGRGLAIVGALADRWGVERDGLGQSVWADLSRG